MKQHVILLLTAFGPAMAAHGAVFTFNPGALVPEVPAAGLALNETLSAAQISGPIASLTVTLNISGAGTSGAYNGDLYAYLKHGTGFAVLLNRPGKTALDPWGYGDNGLAVTFDDSGAADDIHTYQVTLGGPPAGALTGTWASDGRNVDPSAVLDTDPRSATLGSFLGLEASGTWTLYLSDLDGGATAQIDSWALNLNTRVIPEPGTWALASGLGLLGFALWRRVR